MIELFACFGMWLGICGHIETARFQNWDQCQQALVEVKRSKGLHHAYCRAAPAKA